VVASRAAAGCVEEVIVNGTVLVTGVSGFVGNHTVLQLLDAGYTVRTTVRSLDKERRVRAMLENAGAETNDRLSFFVADLLGDEGWVPRLGKARSATSAKAQRELGWSARSWEDAVVATAESLLKLELLTPPIGVG
jgi:nucleoside-diphosphate-sugar epimerase